MVDAEGDAQVVPIEVGMSQGAWVEVTSGLDGDETVVVAGE